MRIKLALLTSLFALGLAHADVIGIEFTGRVVNIDSTTGNFTVVGNSGLTRANCLVDFFGTLYTVDSGQLFRINRSTGASTFVANISAGSGDVRGLASDGGGRVYMITNETPNDKLWSLNLTTGVGTLIGDTGMSLLQSLDCDNIGQLWSYDNLSQGLVRLNRMTGAAFDVNTASGSSADIQSLCFLGNNQLVGGRNQLFLINQTTGASSIIGGNLADVRGMDAQTAFPYPAIPNSFTTRLGQHTGGNVQSLVEEDDNKVETCRFIVPNQSAPPVQLEFESFSPFLQLDSYVFGMKHQALNAGSYQCEFLAFDNVANRFLLEATRTFGTTLVHQGFAGSGNLDRYVAPNGSIRVRVHIKPIGPTPVQTWCHGVDQVYWTLLPHIN
ncbi:MAG: hypothetical protein JNM34_05140 [Chthonomonadaceae bacterium]|nr:hypothetical protein [Chthonomonadaceae bacterium]